MPSSWWSFSTLNLVESIRARLRTPPKWVRSFLKMVASQRFLDNMYNAHVGTLTLFVLFTLVGQIAPELGFGRPPSRSAPDYRIGGHDPAHGIPYPGLSGTIAYVVHVLPGLLYFALGAFQFSSSFRQRRPRTHRLLGLAFFSAQAVSAVGVSLLWGFNKLEGGLAIFWAVPFGLSYWCYTAYKALISAVHHDIPAHERWILRSFYLGWAIIFSRPWTIASFIYQAIFRSNLPQSELWELNDILGSGIVALFQILPVIAEIHIYALYGEGFFASLKQLISDPLWNGVKEPNVKISYIASKDLVASPTAGYTLVPLRPAQPDNFVEATVVSRHIYDSSRTMLVRLQLTVPHTYIHIPPAHHISLRASLISRTGDSADEIRSYTPISTPYDHLNGHIDLLISVDPEGSMSLYIESAAIGTPFHILGTATGRINVPRILTSTPIAAPRLLLIAAGSGIAPLFSILRAAFDNAVISQRTPQVVLIYYSRRHCKSGAEPLRAEIESYVERANGLLEVHFKTGERFAPLHHLDPYVADLKKSGVRDEDSRSEERSWDRETGVSARCFVCGPPEMERKCVEYLVKTCKVSRDRVFAFGLNGR